MTIFTCGFILKIGIFATFVPSKNKGMQDIIIYNTLTRKKEKFVPNQSGHVGMYVCGPTVYGDAHLGHTRPAITFDVVFRYLKYAGFNVRYVRNITDVGHLENDADQGEDKVAKKARLEELEPMEVVQYYTNRYHDAMDALNVQRPSIEPSASGHVIEQIEFVKKIIENGYGYESNGSVYFDIEKYNQDYNYGKLSGRILEDLLETTRELDGQSEKKISADFALWKKAMPEHIMRWPSPWSNGFPGWHLECSTMGTKYLGEKIDIHGGGMDLMFPHHECEIAQSVAAHGEESVNYWMHNNMITINGTKMGKSLGNFITLGEFFSGNHEALEQAYSPMTIRFFILQAHYRSTLDFSNTALQASQKGYDRLMSAVASLEKITPSDKSSVDVASIKEKCFAAIQDDFNTPILIAHLFDAVKVINSLAAGNETISADDLAELISLINDFVYEILGLKDEAQAAGGEDEAFHKAIDLLLTLRTEAKANKDWALSDKIRDDLKAIGFVVKDTADGAEWELE